MICKYFGRKAVREKRKKKMDDALAPRLENKRAIHR
jgi:hypothetical protein